ncbi:MAG: Flp pilus assembly complex ATPase component TadA [Lachnospiraceae bacterium]|nr:Flp pilus assembly complex ATPase component TadA [Lachnospiraceae bacterium]
MVKVREEEVAQLVMERLDPAREYADEEILEEIDRVLLEEGRRRRLSVAERAEYRKHLFDSLRRLDVLQELVEDPSVTEIMVNGTAHIFLERDGRIEEAETRFASREKLEDVIQQIVSRVNRAVNTASPIVDARLEDGSRVNVVLPPVAPDGPILTIRRFPAEPVTMEQLIAWGSITPQAAEFLQILVECGYNLFISGGTGTGKTTFLNALSRYIPAGERVITIEDSLELQLTGIPNLVRLETRNATAQGEHAVSIRDLIRTALRMRPDRILIGEVRGAEALDLLQAFNTGHDGSLSTAHANSPGDLLSRLETMVLMGGDLPLPAIRQQIASAVEVLVQLGRLRGGKRCVRSIVEVLRYEEGEILWQPLFTYSETQGRLLPEGNPLCRCRKLEWAGEGGRRARLQELLAVAP